MWLSFLYNFKLLIHGSFKNLQGTIHYNLIFGTVKTHNLFLTLLLSSAQNIILKYSLINHAKKTSNRDFFADIKHLFSR